MKEFFTWDEVMRDLVLAGLFVLLWYVSEHITPITLDTVSSGEAVANISSYAKAQVNLAPLVNFVVALRPFLGLLGVVLLAGIFFAKIKGNEVHHHEHEQYAPIPVAETIAKAKATQWQFVLDHVNSENPAEWKLAILEADNMLDEILEEEGYAGETVAEKLKTMSPGRIASYEELWEAHKVRNQIAHGGAIDMDLSKKLARDTVARFGNAFKDLGYI